MTRVQRTDQLVTETTLGLFWCWLVHRWPCGGGWAKMALIPVWSWRLEEWLPNCYGGYEKRPTRHHRSLYVRHNDSCPGLINVILEINAVLGGSKLKHVGKS